MNILKASLFFVFSFSIFTGCGNLTEAQSSASSGLRNTNTKNEVKAEIQTPEQKAARIAEEFIKRNGYTNEPADKNNLSHESIEISADIDELLKFRKNSLEAKAYAILPHGKGSAKGWTLAFRYNKNYLDKVYRKNAIDEYNTLGRAVVMNGIFENLRVEHKSILLKNLEKIPQ